jgi:hypothetical protein
MFADSKAMSDRILNGVFGAFFGCFSVWLIGALFSARFLSNLHWGKGRGGPPVSRLSIFVFLPFCIYIFVEHSIIALGYEWRWKIPPWLFFVYFGLFILCSVRDSRNARGVVIE